MVLVPVGVGDISVLVGVEDILILGKYLFKILQSLEAMRFVLKVLITLKFDRHLSSTAAEMPVKFQSGKVI